jgi:comEA protein
VPSQAPPTRRHGASARLLLDFRNMQSALLATALIFSLSSAFALAQKIPPTRPINLNTATIAELESLPGVGANTAKSIIDFRKHSGPFQRVEDLLAIKGISKTKLEKLRPYVTVAPNAPKPQPTLSH